MNTPVLKPILPEQAYLLEALYTAAGWSNYTQDAHHLATMIAQSTYTIGAFTGPILMGFVRGFSDNCSVHFIQDIIVEKSFRRQGVGSLLLQEATLRYNRARKIVLLTDDDPSTKAFYTACGFSLAANDQGTQCYIKKGRCAKT